MDNQCTRSITRPSLTGDNIENRLLTFNIPSYLLECHQCCIPQVQGYVEHFSGEDKGVVQWLSSSLYFLAFSEGWALYSEDPLIARESDSYKDLPLMKFGALKWQVGLETFWVVLMRSVTQPVSLSCSQFLFSTLFFF